MTETREQRPLYVGYQSHAAKGTARFLGPRIVGMLAIALLIALLVVLVQRPFAVASFEFGQTREFNGIVSEFPYPTLLVARPGRSDDMPYSRYLLSGQGKFGVADELTGRHGQNVALSGTLIYRDEQAMIEVLPDSLTFMPQTAALPVDESLGTVTLRGEVIDSKCYLGVMKPAAFKPHKACAIRCLSGGIPALFVVRGTDGSADHVLLAGPDGRALNQQLLDIVATPVEVTGTLRRSGSDLILHTDATAFQTLQNVN
ncbi:MAG: hypothetical protein AB8G17_03035 [Gammaproteobacteria bacterium]